MISLLIISMMKGKATENILRRFLCHFENSVLIENLFLRKKEKEKEQKKKKKYV